MTYRVNRTNTKQGSSLGTAKQNRHPALSPLATAIKVAIVGVGLAAHSAGQAATIEVNSNLDNGSQCTLRDAIISINDGVLRPGCVSTVAAFGTDDTINVAASVASDTITVVNSALEIEPGTTVLINGNGVTVDADNGRFEVNSATLSIDDMTITKGGGITIFDGSTVTLSNSTITESSGIGIRDGSTVTINNSTISDNSSRSYGGGISVEDSSLTVNNTRIVDNRAYSFTQYAYSGYGGGISARYSDVTINNSTILGNFAYEGGGIDADSESSIIISNSIISGNSASLGTGGIEAFEANINVTDSTISDNVGGGLGAGGIKLGRLSGNWSIIVNNSTILGNSTRGDGGGISVALESDAIIRNSTISSNSAERGGGGISALSADVTVINSTISGNLAYDSRFPTYGGGILGKAGSNVTVINSTISDNSAVEAGGIYTRNDATANVSNSIIANSIGGDDCSNPVRNNQGAIVESDSASIIEDGSCGTDARAVDPLLLPLADNGCTVMHATPNGPACVMTHALAAGSPAIDTAVDSDLETDQIGTLRPQGAADVGAFELSSIIPTSPGFAVTAVNAVEGDKVLFTITLDEPQLVSVGYDFSTQAGTAIDGEDYLGRVGRVFFPAGETVAKRRITTLEDGVLNEGTETFSLVVTDINDPSSTITTQAMIQEDANAVPQLSVEEVRVNEGDEKAVVVITLSQPSAEPVSVRFANSVRPTQNNPATAGDDYIDRSGTIIFAPGATRRTRTITLIDDNVDEANEVFRFELSDPSNAEIAEGSERQRVFILNDD